MIPRTALPIACQGQGCRIEFCWVFNAAAPAESVPITHIDGEGRASELPILSAWLDDASRDIWSDDVKPWMERLHAGEEVEA